MPSRRLTISYGIAALAVSALVGRVANATVWNGSELRRALDTLAPGSRIKVMPGAYGDCGGFPVTTDGLIIEGHGEGCVLQDPMVILATGTVIDGQTFRSSPLKVSGADTIVRNCDFSVNTNNLDMMNIAASALRTEVYTCRFHDALAAAQACLSIGSGQSTANTAVSAYVHDNTFANVQAGSQETLYMKSSGNRVVNNTLTSANNITSRCGSNNVIQGNKSSGGYGIVVQDDNNHVIGNTITTPDSGHGFFIMAGDAPYTSNAQGIHAQAYNTEVSGNTGPLMIGKQYGSSYTYPALNTRVSNHTGPITHMHDQGTTITGGSGTRTVSPAAPSAPAAPAPTAPSASTTPAPAAPSAASTSGAGPGGQGGHHHRHGHRQRHTVEA
jgi:hypothetical protein